MHPALYYIVIPTIAYLLVAIPLRRLELLLIFPLLHSALTLTCMTASNFVRR
ncbi:hypothetical protein IW261DRAFT_1509498 [Armillaria novae-zelandiae]|uniref:Uncharacterized protein n=1 Tax=Armillaria novae-zelandiae TaxID=153914 RepID=A0AA39NUN3_9AGAR|nr:hypothetical protein IW261DRAFT_1509498 [Armillaria novae-zelandiae]